jgi:hypothetical protein
MSSKCSLRTGIHKNCEDLGSPFVSDGRACTSALSDIRYRHHMLVNSSFNHEPYDASYAAWFMHPILIINDHFVEFFGSEQGVCVKVLTLGRKAHWQSNGAPPHSGDSANSGAGPGSTCHQCTYVSGTK